MRQVKWAVINGVDPFQTKKVIPIVSVLHQSLLDAPCTCEIRYVMPSLDKCHRCRILDQIRAFTVEDPVRW